MFYKTHSINHRHFVILITAIAALSGLLFGYDTGVISGAMIFIKPHFHLSTVFTEVVVSSVLLGAVLGAIASGRLADVFGRKSVMLAAALAFLLGTALCALAPNVLSLILGRLIVGLAIGMASYAAPLYISEIAPASCRGSLVILNTITVTGGIVLAYLVDLAFSPWQNWRWMLGLGLVPALLLGCGVIFLPHSPRWMAQKGRLRVARCILHRIRHSDEEVDNELKLIKKNIENYSKGGLRDLFTPGIRMILILGVGLAAIQQVTGINTILYYAPMIFQAAGFKGTLAQLLATLGMGVANFVMTIVATWLVDRVGRRPLLLIGLAFMAISLTMVSVVFRYNMHNPMLQWLAVLSLVIFVAFYALSIGCLFWLVISEIYPLHIRGMAMSIATMANWFANLLVAMSFLSLLEKLGPSATFGLYAAAAVLSWLFSYSLVPETKQVPLEVIEANLKAGKPTRRLGEAPDTEWLADTKPMAKPLFVKIP